MPLEPKQEFCIRCGDIHTKEVTGLYDPDDNPGGYGAPNPGFGDTTPYTVTFYAPGSSTPAFVLDLLDNPPTPDSDGHLSYVVTRQDLGFATKDDIPSGIWKVVVLHGTIETKYTILAYGEISSMVNKCICCGGVKHLALDYQLKAALRLYKCRKNKEAQRAIDKLYKDTAACCDCGCN